MPVSVRVASYRVALGKSAGDLVSSAETRLMARTFGQ
jgi:hypothetical protein